ncbi:hypothetical protein [Sporomusa sp. KB1]|jgi:hypothetical protein|uniref:hypothetical protein n=1 Tax=Sporomusa sp. KB1 TaxID=943346 RepID=UPI0011AAB08B|nr:hypothetical protein [Sporomusa sp. KB1]TWH45886.1 hypothetical protein Salpa_1818 [Sporomusa sp. KB1]
MKILRYLTWFGEDAIHPGTILYTLAYAIQQVIDAVENGINYMVDQIYLMTATGEWLDRWAWDLARLRRQTLESDEAFRARLILTLFRVRVIRKAIRQAVKTIAGRYPVEIFEPIRDTAYWNAGFFYVPKQEEDTAAATDGSGVYCARLGTLEDTSYTGYVRVRLAGDYRGGAGLSYFNAAAFYGRSFFFSSTVDTKRALTRDDVLTAVHLVQPAGTQVFVEFLQ